MNDIDFDELDRAVSSLIGKPRDQPSGEASSVPPRPSVSQPSPSSRPNISPLSGAPRAAGSTVPSATAPTPTPAARRSGRFMDVVHPSQPTKPEPQQQSGLRPAPSMSSQAGRGSIGGRSIDPIQKPASMPQTSPMPTPMDIKKPHPVEEEEEPLLEAKAESHPEVTSSSNETKKPTDFSPPLFLSGTKVEKRPLGAFSSPKPSPSMDSEKQPETNPKPEQQSNVNLPPELDQRLVQLEAADSGVDAEERPDTPPAYPPDPEAVKPETPRPQPSVQQAAHAASHSIPTQYRAKQTEPDMTPHPIFDTDHYDHPVTQSHKKPTQKKPWLWIVIIVILLAIGAGLGVGAYFLLG